MLRSDALIRNAMLYDGSGAEPEVADVAISGDRIVAIGPKLVCDATATVEANGLALAPGFIDTHTHDDTVVLRSPQMQPKISQGVTTVVTGNCGISAAPVQLKGDPPDPMNLLGNAGAFRFPTFAAYVAAVAEARPAINVAALVGHTSLRSNHMDRLDREASSDEVAAMRAQLEEALAHGALGLSTGLAYLSANAATTDEVIALAEPLAAAEAIYTTHLRSETAAVLEALQEAFTIGGRSRVPIVVSHLKCAGVDNWGRSTEILAALDAARAEHPVACDCYPYAASSSTLDLRQVDERVKITVTWSTPHPEMASKTLAEIADEWGLPQVDAARRLQPAGAIYHCMSEDDVRRVLRHPATMIGSDGLPLDPHPHPRLWGTFPRVLGRYSREEKLFPLAEALHKMTGLPAQNFRLDRRGLIREGYFADLVLFDPATIRDAATFDDPEQPAVGVHSVWVNGAQSYTVGGVTEKRAGRFLPRASATVRSKL
ncbi:MAG TPA: D-aminoacylase [Acidobacteriaceae bacterium]|nr:D-aminoacylase [Acidobacteriaceae bacterium]